MGQDRLQQIGQILQDLRVKKNTTTDRDLLYAIDENIVFFEASKSPFKYLWWILFRMPKIDCTRVLEINDILPKWDKEMHIKLMEVEKRKFPGLIKPLVENIVEHIKKENRPLVLADIGFGGMETERQVIEKLIEDDHQQPIVFVGIDQSLSAHEIAKENLSPFKDKIQYHDIDQLSDSTLKDTIKSNTGITVIACRNDIFNFSKIFGQGIFDLSYHSLFKHHLNDQQQKKLDRVLQQISKKVLEYDGFRSNISLIPQTKNGWGHPAFLNAAIFSNLRFNKQHDLSLQSKQKGKKILFFRQKGNYLMK